jgi:hypothetical protein
VDAIDYFTLPEFNTGSVSCNGKKLEDQNDLFVKEGSIVNLTIDHTTKELSFRKENK